MAKVLLAAVALIAVQILLIVWIGRAIGYRDKISRARAKAGASKGPITIGYRAARRRAS